MVPRIFALVIKEFLALLKDPKSRFVIITPPLVQLLVFGYAATFDLENVSYAVYNESPAEASQALIARFRGSSNFYEVATITRDEQIVPLIDNKQVLLVVHIGPQFNRDLWIRGGAAVQVIIDGRDSNTAMLALGDALALVTSRMRNFGREDFARSHPAGSLGRMAEQRSEERFSRNAETDLESRMPSSA